MSDFLSESTNIDEAAHSVEDDPCADGNHCCCCGPGDACCDCGIVMTQREEQPDWANAATCIENAEIAYEDSIEGEDGPVDTVISSGDLGVVIGLAKHALSSRVSDDDLDSHAARLEMVKTAVQAIIDQPNNALPLARAALDFCNLTQAERAEMRGDA